MILTPTFYYSIATGKPVSVSPCPLSPHIWIWKTGDGEELEIQGVEALLRLTTDPARCDRNAAAERLIYWKRITGRAAGDGLIIRVRVLQPFFSRINEYVSDQCFPIWAGWRGGREELVLTDGCCMTWPGLILHHLTVA